MLSWPRRTAISLAVAASQMRAVLSADAVTMRDPSGLKAADYGARMASQDRDLLAGGGVPDAGGLVPEAVTMREPSGLKTARSTWPSCPPKLSRQLDCPDRCGERRACR